MSNKSCNECIHNKVCSKRNSIKDLVYLLYLQTGRKKELGYEQEKCKYYGYIADKCKFFGEK